MRIFLVVLSLLAIDFADADPALEGEVSVSVHTFSQRLKQLIHKHHGAENIVWVSGLHGVLTDHERPGPTVYPRGDMPDVVHNFMEAGGNFIIASTYYKFDDVLRNIEQIGLQEVVGAEGTSRKSPKLCKKRRGKVPYRFYRRGHVISVRNGSNKNQDRYFRAKHMAIDCAKEKRTLQKKPVIIFTDVDANSIRSFQQNMSKTNWYQTGEKYVYTFLFTNPQGQSRGDDYSVESKIPASLISSETDSTYSSSDCSSSDDR